MGNNGLKDVFKTKVDCVPKIVPIDDIMINQNQLQNCAYFYVSNSKYRVEESFSAQVNGVTWQSSKVCFKSRMNLLKTT